MDLSIILNGRVPFKRSAAATGMYFHQGLEYVCPRTPPAIVLPVGQGATPNGPMLFCADFATYCCSGFKAKVDCMVCAVWTGEGSGLDGRGGGSAHARMAIPNHPPT